MKEYIEIRHKLITVLGVSFHNVNVRTSEYMNKGEVIFQPYEEERIHKEQCIKFLTKLHDGERYEGKITKIQLRFIIRTLNEKY